MAIPTTFCVPCAAAIILMLNHQMAPGDVCRPSVEAFLHAAEQSGLHAGMLQARSFEVIDHGKSLDLNTYQATRSYDARVGLPFGVQQVQWVFVDEVLVMNEHKAKFRALAHLAVSRDMKTPLWYVYVPVDEEQDVAMVQLFTRSVNGGCIEAPFFGVQLPLPRAGP